MPLIHKSVDVLPATWKKLRINAELTGVPLRDYLTYLIQQSEPIEDSDTKNRGVLDEIHLAHREAVRG